MTYELLRLADDQLLDVLAVADRERRAGDGARREPRDHQWIAKRLLERGHGAPKFHMTSHHRARRGRGDEPRDRAVAPARRAGADRPRVGHRGGADDPRRADARRARLRRDLPAVPLPHGDRHRQARPRGREVVLQPAAARRGVAGGGLGRARRRHVPGATRPTTRRTGSTRPASCRRATRRPSRKWPTACPAWRCACRLLSRRACGKGRLTLQPVRRADRDQPRAHVRPVSAQGHDRGRLGRRPRDLGSGNRGDARPLR